MKRGKLVSALLVACLVGAGAGCARGNGQEPPEPSSSASAISATVDDVTVTGTLTQRPTISYEMPLDVTMSSTRVVVRGDGDVPAEDTPILLRMYAQNARTGVVLRDDFTDVPRTYTMSEKALGTDLYQALRDVRVGSRVVHATADSSTDVPVVMTIDLIATRATGDPIAGAGTGKNSMPTVSLDGDGTPHVTIPADTPAPTSLKVETLRRGTGPQVTDGAAVVLQYVAVRWSSGEVYATTWGPESTGPATVVVGEDRLVESIEETLDGVPVGSQLLVVVPPEEAYALSQSDLSSETMVYVFDVLAVPLETAEEPSQEESP